MSPEDMKTAVELAEANAIERLESMAEVFAPDGVAYDQETMNDAEFVAWVEDLATRPDPLFVQQYPEMSVLAFLRDVSPEVYEPIMTRYYRIVPKRAFGVAP